MIKQGKVKKYNGKYGLIESENEIIDFSSKDISLGQELKEEDIVEFRIEEKFPNIKIARNINILNNYLLRD